jgi:dihydroxyacetone kinase
MLEGIVSSSPQLALLSDEDVVLRADIPPFDERRQVAVISGGGSGHEPPHAGYVGMGMLHAAVCGDVFTSPSTDAVLAAIRAVAGKPGALLVVKNYTGDRLNFGLAAELARAEGIPVEIVVVADDVALRDTVEPARRRGIAGTVLVHKIAGAAAEAGAPLSQVAAEAGNFASAVGTMGVGLGSCIVPAAGKPGFTLGEDEVELGLGIHGERGVRRTKLETADQFVDIILETVVTDKQLRAGDRVALMVNGLGGTTPMELSVVGRHALAALRAKGLVVERSWTGNLLTALEMPGFSLTVVKLDDGITSRLDAETQAFAWPRGGVVAADMIVLDSVKSAAVEGSVESMAPSSSGQMVKAAALRIAAAFEAEEERLTQLDSAAGDGDLGISFVRGAEAIKALPVGAWSNPATALTSMGDALRKAIAGSSGPFYATALLRAAKILQGILDPSTREWAQAFDSAVISVSELGGARPGDRTMIDALRPAADTFLKAVDGNAEGMVAWLAALDAAIRGMEETTTMSPRLGRASYLGARAIGVPDAGASAVVVWMKAIATSL